jgi:hypothetical protein
MVGCLPNYFTPILKQIRGVQVCTNFQSSTQNHSSGGPNNMNMNNELVSMWA